MVSLRKKGAPRALGLLVVSLTTGVLSIMGQVDPAPDANIQVFRRLAFDIGSDLRQRVPAAAPAVISVAIYPREIGLPLEQELGRGMGIPAGRLSLPDTAGLRMEFAVTEARVVLEDGRRNGFLGASVVDRVIILSGRARTSGAGSPEMYYDVTRSLRDTVGLSGIESLESPTLSFTRMTIPRQGFFENLLEPVVVLGAVGVAVYLLFAVRS